MAWHRRCPADYLGGNNWPRSSYWCSKAHKGVNTAQTFTEIRRRLLWRRPCKLTPLRPTPPRSLFEPLQVAPNVSGPGFLASGRFPKWYSLTESARAWLKLILLVVKLPTQLDATHHLLGAVCQLLFTVKIRLAPMPAVRLSRHAHYAAATAVAGWFGGCSEQCRWYPLASARFQDRWPRAAVLGYKADAVTDFYAYLRGLRRPWRLCLSGTACCCSSCRVGCSTQEVVPRGRGELLCGGGWKRSSATTAATPARRISAVVTAAAAGFVCVAVGAGLGQWDRRP